MNLRIWIILYANNLTEFNKTFNVFFTMIRDEMIVMQNANMSISVTHLTPYEPNCVSLGKW